MIRLNLADVDWATTLLADAFEDKLPATVLFRGPARRAQVEYFMRCTFRYAIQSGEGYTTPDRSGVALWLVPGATAMTPGRMWKAGMLAAPFHMGPGGFRRFLAFARHTDAMHGRAMPEPHYYLFALGVAPDGQGRGVGRQLTGEMLAKIDEAHMPAYLETQFERNVPLYRSLGFRVVEQAPFPGLEGLCNWAMARPATT